MSCNVTRIITPSFSYHQASDFDCSYKKWFNGVEMIEWDEQKDRSNIEKHGISFLTAARIFDGPILTFEETRFEYGEIRGNSIGMIDGILVLTVTHTDRDGRTRIMSARRADRAEMRRYDEAIRRELTVEELAAMPDENTDYSDIPALDDDFWKLRS